MKISYSIAILLGSALVQLVSARAPGTTHEDLASFKPAPFTHEVVEKREMNSRYLATALRRRQINTLSPTATPAAAVSPKSQVHTTMKKFTDAVKQTLASDDGADDQGEEETHDSEEQQEKHQQKELIKLTEKLVKAINALLKAAGFEDECVDLDGVFKSAKKGMLAPPTATAATPELEARGLDSLFQSLSGLDRNLMASAAPAEAAAPAAPAAPAEAPSGDVENDGGDDGSTEGDKQHHDRLKTPGVGKVKNSDGGTAGDDDHHERQKAPGVGKVKNSDGGTEGDDAHHQRHPNPAKKRSSDEQEKPDPKEIKSAENKVNDALEELKGAGMAAEDENASGITQIEILVQQLLACFD